MDQWKVDVVDSQDTIPAASGGAEIDAHYAGDAADGRRKIIPPLPSQERRVSRFFQGFLSGFPLRTP